MDLSLYVEDIRKQFEVAASALGDDARALAERLVSSLEASFRLALQDALTAAAEEITTELAPGSVEVRLRGRDLEFAVVPPPVDLSLVAETSENALAGGPPPIELAPQEGEEGAISRINLRLPDHVKGRVERAADREGLSINGWLVRAARAALERSERAPSSEQRPAHGAQRYTGWAR